MYTSVYIRDPDLADSYFVFVCDDDLWKVPFVKGNFASLVDPSSAKKKTLSSHLPPAIRLTNSAAQIRHPKISPRGDYVAYMSNESGEWDIYLTTEHGGISKRLTYKGDTSLVGWNSDGHILYTSETGQYMATTIYEITIDGAEIQTLRFGRCGYFHNGQSGSVIGRDMGDIATWKNYRGGNAGQIWVKKKGQKAFKRILADMRSQIGNVVADGKSIYFLTDKDGSGNVYTTDYAGTRCHKITDCKPFYIRSFSVHRKHLLFASAGDLWLQLAGESSAHRLAVTVHSSFDQSRPRYINAEDYTTHFACSYHGSMIAVIVRGSLYTMRPFLGGCRLTQIDDKIVRFRDIYPFGKARDFIAVGVDQGGEDRLVQCLWQQATDTYNTKILPLKNSGKIRRVLVADDASFILYSTLRQELWLQWLGKASKAVLLAQSDTLIDGFDISADKKWIVYSRQTNMVDQIYVYSLQSKSSTPLIRSYGDDCAPVFDPKENLLYFLSTREFSPVYADGPNDLTFFGNTKPYVVYLDKSIAVLSQRRLNFKSDEESSVKEDKMKSKASKKASSVRSKATKKATKKAKVLATKIDFDNIDQRVHPLPVAAGGWRRIYVSGDKIFLVRSSFTHTSEEDGAETSSSQRDMKIYHYQKSTDAVTFSGEAHGITMSGSGKYFLIQYHDNLSLVSCDEKTFNDDDEKDKPKLIDLSRVRHRIDPHQEWKQMLSESWYLQKDHFNNPSCGIPFESILKRYLSIVDKVKTRSEFSHLLWDMQGELKTSHCYVRFGDYYKKPAYLPTARLGADLRYIKSKRCYAIERIYMAESHYEHNRSPLIASGISLQKGDEIYSVGGLTFSKSSSLDEYLENKAGTTVELRVKRRGKKRFENLTVATLSKFSYLSYFDWCYGNREFVRKISRDTVGYLHVPDMMDFGLSQFYKHYVVERCYPHVIIDMRHNRGGYISSTLIAHLMAKALGTGSGKWQKNPHTYPAYAAPQNMVCLINGSCGSDGDIFAGAFKELGLGKLIGTRTWGGVIGIWPRITLVDGTVTTQPEFDFAFGKNKTSLENEGVLPDIHLDLTPEDYQHGIDKQLICAVNTLKEQGSSLDKLDNKRDKKMHKAPKRKGNTKSTQLTARSSVKPAKKSNKKTNKNTKKT
ncbi:MAG: S41 family peptidase [Proteobacteria bacterium]|nr:S41 family peptidase [Pseudomonadota bacterium]